MAAFTQRAQVIWKTLKQNFPDSGKSENLLNGKYAENGELYILNIVPDQSFIDDRVFQVGKFVRAIFLGFSIKNPGPVP